MVSFPPVSPPRPYTPPSSPPYAPHALPISFFSCKHYSVKIPMLSHQSTVAKDSYVRYRNKNWFSGAIGVVTNWKQKAVTVYSNLSWKRCCVVYVWRELLAQIAAPANAQCYCTSFTISVNLQKVYYCWRKAFLRKLIHKVTSFQFPRSLCTCIFNIFFCFYGNRVEMAFCKVSQWTHDR